MTVALAHTILGDRSLPMLVMSSSLGTTRSMWEPQHALQSQYCLLLYDHRGHGASPAPDGPYSIDELGEDVIALLDHLGVETASFCGLSLGGMVGLWLASQHPQRIDRLIVMCALAQTRARQPVQRARARGSRRWPRIHRRRRRVALVHPGIRRSPTGHGAPIC